MRYYYPYENQFYPYAYQVSPYRRQTNSGGLLLIAAALLFIPIVKRWSSGGNFF